MLGLAFFVFLPTQVMVGDLFNGGRIAMHTFARYVGPLARWLDLLAEQPTRSSRLIGAVS